MHIKTWLIKIFQPTRIFIILLIITILSAFPIYVERTTAEVGGHAESLVTIGLNNVDAGKFGCTKECDYDCIPGPNGDCIAQKKFCWWDCPVTNPPTITSTLNCSTWGNNNWCKGTLSITLTANDPQSLSVQIDGDIEGAIFTCPAQTGTVTCTIPLSEGAGTVNYTATSVSGETADGSTDWFLDSTAPTLSGSLSGSSGAGGWFTSNVSVSLSASDPTSGLVSVEYSLDGTTWNPYTSSFTLSDGMNSVQMRATDNAGNVKSLTQAVNIDTQTPAIAQSLSGTAGNNNWYVTLLQVTANASDSTSGISSIEVSLDGGAWTLYSAPFSLSDGHHTWQLRATDNAGNTKTAPVQSADIDTTTPLISTSTTGTLGNNNWYVTNVQVSAAANDSMSGLNALEYTVDNGSWTTYSGPIAFTEGIHSYQLRATDNAGNVTTTVSQSIQVDTTTPNLTITIAGTKGIDGWYVSNATVTANPSDSTSGIASMQQSLDHGLWTNYTAPLVFSDGQHTYQFKVTDNAGNVTQTPLLSLNSDTVAPVVEIEENWNAKNPVYYSAKDSGSQLNNARLVIQKSDSIKAVIVDGDIHGTTFSNDLSWDAHFNNGLAASEGDYPVSLKVSDSAGNQTIVTTTVHVDFSLFSLVPSVPSLTNTEEEAIQPDSNPDQFNFGNETSGTDSDQTSTTESGGETSGNVPGLQNVETEFAGETVQPGETSTFNFSNMFNFFPGFDEANQEANLPSAGALMLSILAAAAAGAATAQSTNSGDTNVLWGKDAEEAQDSFADQVKQWIWEHSPHPGNSEEAREEENDGPKSYKQIAAEYTREKAIQEAKEQQVIEAQKYAKYAQGDVTEQELLDARHYQDWVNEQKLEAAEYADVTEDERYAAYVASPQYQSYQQELTEYHSAQAEQAKPWWERAWDKTLDLVDNHQTSVSLGVGIGVGLVTAAIVLMTLPLTVPVIVGATLAAAVIAGAAVATGTAALNNYYDRPVFTNMGSNIFYGAGSALAVSGLALTAVAWPIIGNTISGYCALNPAICSRVDVALNSIDKLEEGGLVLQGAIQKAMGDEQGAQETAFQLQLEQMDGGMPGNTVAAELDNAIAKYGDNATELIARYGDDGIKYLQLDIEDIPRGFENISDYAEFGITLRNNLSNIGYEDVQPIFQGSSVTGQKFTTGVPFDVGRVSDYDIALASPSLLEKAQALGIDLRGDGIRTGPLTIEQLESLGLLEVANQLSEMAGRPVNFMIYSSVDAAITRSPSIIVP